MCSVDSSITCVDTNIIRWQRIYLPKAKAHATTFYRPIFFSFGMRATAADDIDAFFANFTTGKKKDRNNNGNSEVEDGFIIKAHTFPFYLASFPFCNSLKFG